MTHNVKVAELSANEGGQGNLVGWKLSCPCGFFYGTTMQSEIPFIIAEHQRVMSKRTAINEGISYLLDARKMLDEVSND